ncbi:MAG: TonB-dependent receptor [Gammaproteobacteria bacterium]|nr:MAG: TonB-dependent receptor [Gammaproteobacteria bacterium]
MKNHFLIPVLSILSISTISNAAETKLDDVVVTATRTAISADESIVPVVVITADDIKKSPANDIPTLLSGTAGINVGRSGGLGGQTSIFVRGTESNHLLVLIDGVRAGSLSIGATAIEHIPLELVERIELIKGNRSSLYGSDAIGGVLQIFTKKGADDGSGFHPSVLISTGSNETHKMSFAVSGGMDGFSMSMTGAFLHSGGYDVTLDSNPNNNPDDDSYSNDSVSLNIGKLWDNGIKLDLLYMDSDANVEFDGWYYESDVDNSLSSLKLFAPLGDKVDLTFQVAESKDELVSYDSFGSSENKSRRRQQTLQVDYSPTDELQLSLGLERQQDKLNSTNYADQKIKNKSSYIQGIYEVGIVGVLAGFRNDDYGVYGDENTWNIGASFDITESIKLTANSGTGFKVPTFNDLFWPGGGNPELLPEKSKNYEIGVGYDVQLIQIQLNIYKTEVEDLIAGWPSTNINKAKISGEELIVKLPGNKIADFVIELSHVDATDDATGDQLLKRPVRSGKISAAKTIGAFDIALTAFGYSSSLDWGGTEAAGYGVFGGVINYELNKHVDFTLRAENLFDKKYSSVYGYSSPGRSFMLEMTAGF